MNPLTHNKTIRTQRDGLSIVEVLTSVVVAMIGVFGVMILIPFAVKQAQSGLDKDASVVVARNAYSMFEIGGYRIPTNWGVFRGTDGGGNPIVSAYSPYGVPDLNGDGAYTVPQDDANGDGVLDVDDADPPMIFTIDPLAINSNLINPGTGATDLPYAYNTSVFPFNRVDPGAPFPTGRGNGIHLVPPVAAGGPDLRFTPANLGTPSGGVMGLASARRMFMGNDDLIFGEAANVDLDGDGKSDAPFLGPQQQYDSAISGADVVVNARRQFNGRLSWSAIAVPFKDDPTIGGTDRWSYQLYILVYRDRVVDASAFRTGFDQMVTAQVSPAMNGLNSPVTNVLLDASTTTVEGFVNRDDWVMMINQSPTAEAGFDRQVAFYRVVNVADAGSGAPAMLTLDGPDFRFDDGSGALSDTHIVHLRNVVGVYERTFQPEFESIWTIRANQ